MGGRPEKRPRRRLLTPGPKPLKVRGQVKLPPEIHLLWPLEDKRQTSSTYDLPPSLPRGKNDLTEGYWWFFGEEAPPGAQQEWDKKQAQKRQEEARRRVEGYEWFFD